jgi:hypothetical protein
MPAETRQTIGAFLKQEFPPKEPLIEGVLYRRDMISLTGRRRHGKTTFLHNLALAGALGKPEFLGFKIPRPFRTISFYLEDDAMDLQPKLRCMLDGKEAEGFDLYTRADFLRGKIPINIKNPRFQNIVFKKCAAAKPDLIIFDNLGMLIQANYNDASDIHELMDFCFRLTQEFNAAVLIAAHPRKGHKLDENNGAFAVSLLNSPERFFEECMGSSHFINSTGSLWGIERHEDDQTFLLLGSQRLTGRQVFTVAEKDEHEWLRRVDDVGLAMKAAVNTVTRKASWAALPNHGEKFSYIQARDCAKAAGMKSPATFNAWWKELIRQRLVFESGPERYERVPPGEPIVGEVDFSSFAGQVRNDNL